MLQTLTHGHALSVLSFYILTVDTPIASTLSLDIKKLANFLSRVEISYNDNPYHNATHAADVLQMYNTLCSKVFAPRCVVWCVVCVCVLWCVCVWSVVCGVQAVQ